MVPNYADHQVQSHQVNTQYCEAPSDFGVFPVLVSNTCSSHFLSQISQCLPCFALYVVSLPDWFTRFLCLHPSVLMPVVLRMKRKGWDLADKKLRYLKMLTYYNAWTYHVSYCHVLPSFSCCSHHLYIYGPPLWRGLLRVVKHFMCASKLNICPEFLFLHQCPVHPDDATRYPCLHHTSASPSGKDLQTQSIVLWTNSCGTVH